MEEVDSTQNKIFGERREMNTKLYVTYGSEVFVGFNLYACGLLQLCSVFDQRIGLNKAFAELSQICQLTRFVSP